MLPDASGCFVRAFADNLGWCPVAVAELWGAYYALDLAWVLGFRKIIIELDSSCAIALIEKTSLIRRIQQLLDRAWEVKIQHVYREANRAANFMASRGHSLPLG